MRSLDDVLSTARENWRVLFLVTLLLISSMWLFLPSAATQGPTNLKYGLQLEGGTRVRAPFVGITAEGVSMQGMTTQQVEQFEANVSTELGVPARQVEARPQQRAVEVYRDDVTASQLESALEAEGKAPGNVRPGVTKPTRETAKRVLEQKFRESTRVSGATVQVTQSATGQHFILIQVPGSTRDQVLDLIRSRGQVRVVALFPAQEMGGQRPTPTPGTPTPNATTAPNVTTPNGTATPTPNGTPNGTATPTGTASPTATPTPNETGNGTAQVDPPEGYRAISLFTQEDLKSVGAAEESQAGNTYVPVTLKKPAARNFSDAMRKWGFTTRGVGSCRWQFSKQDPGYCLLVVRDGTVVNAFSMGDLADVINKGGFTKSPSFRLLTRNMSEARRLRVDLQAGALPTRLDLDQGTITYIKPGLAGEFKLYSLVTGIIAALAVSGVVFLRYRDPRVAAPMWLTALSEVFILLGVAAALSFRLNLAHIAGFIAVIGTGVDDLIIIADEVMSQGDVRTRRVFQSRFRKAFWVIGAAAMTTIIAMSPLTVLGLGELGGFAIITIIGVLVGVLVTRPAYGDILRALITRGED